MVVSPSWLPEYFGHSGMVRRTRPGISRFSDVQLHIIVRRFASPRNALIKILIDDRGLNHGAELIAQHAAAAVVALHHVDRDHLLFGIDQEQRAGIAGPAIFAERARQCGIPDTGANLEAQSKTQSRR